MRVDLVSKITQSVFAKVFIFDGKVEELESGELNEKEESYLSLTPCIEGDIESRVQKTSGEGQEWKLTSHEEGISRYE